MIDDKKIEEAANKSILRQSMLDTIVARLRKK